jgi:hypothetical protein
MKAQKTYSLSGTILFFLSLIYLGAELVFNRQLLDISSSVSSDPAQVEHIQYFGRVTSGFGFTLLVLGIFQRCGFRINNRKQWAVFGVTAFICLLPFITTFGQALFETTTDTPYTAGMIWGLFPFIGLYYVLISKGRTRFGVILGLIILAWPAMFYGQKLAVERLVISPTTAEERLNAHYVLLLRAGIEGCVIALEGTQFCDEGGSTDVEKRSARAILGPLFMLNFNAAFKDLSLTGGQVIGAIAAQDLWFSSTEYYRRYLQQVAAKRGQYERYLDKHYYLPYKNASDLYLKSAEPGKLEKMAEDASLQAEAGVEKGWQEYQQAVAAYHNALLGGIVRTGQTARSREVTKLCENHRVGCERIIQKGAQEEIAGRIYDTAEQNFYNRTGYSPDIKNKEDFLKDPKTQKEVRAHTEKKVQETIAGYTFPANWEYNPFTFKTEFLQLLQNQAQTGWQDKVQSQFKTAIPPGLERDDFFRYLNVAPPPPLDDMVMPKTDFMKKYVVPMNRGIAAAALKKIREEAPGYANGQSLAEQGKDYIRVLYVPAIALCLSLMIVVMTIGRYLVNIAAELATKTQAFIRPACWGLFLVVALGLPYLWPNPYTSGAAYQKYYHLARENSPGAAILLDWVVHVQPLIYRAGSI